MAEPADLVRAFYARLAEIWVLGDVDGLRAVVNSEGTKS